MKLEVTLELSHLNVRREKQGDENGSVAADLKLSGQAPIAKLRGLFSTKASFERLLESLYTKEGELVSSDLTSLKLKTEAHSIRIELSNQDELKQETTVFENAELNKVVISPLAGRVADVSLRLQVKPSDPQIAALAELLMEIVTLNVDSLQMELPVERDEQEEQEQEEENEEAGAEA